MKRLLGLIISMASIFGLIVLVGVLLKPEDTSTKEKKVDADALKKNLKTPEVYVSAVRYESLIKKVYGTGTLRGVSETDIMPKVSGEIETIFVSNGQNLSKNDFICQLNTDKIDFKIIKAKAKLAQLKDDLILRYKEDNLEIKKETLIFSSAKELLLLKNQLYQAMDKQSVLMRRVGYTDALISVHELELEKSYHSIKAPFDGRISELTLSQGNQISSAKSIAKLSDDRQLIARVGVLPSDASQIKVNSSVEILDRELTGKVIGIGLDPKSATVS